MLEAKDRQGQPVARFGPQKAGGLTCFQTRGSFGERHPNPHCQ